VGMGGAEQNGSSSLIQRAGLFGGPAMALLVFALLGTSESELLTPAGRAVASSGVWMAVWWMTEAVALPVTSLLPLVLFPLLGVSGVQEAASPYAHRLIFLFGGGFLMALSMERWGLHERIALRTVLMVGSSPRAIVGGSMLITALMSMWVSNTATTVMMLPIALSLIGLHGQRETDKRFGVCLLLGIAYAASVGGVATIIGTPPNTVLMTYLEEVEKIKISFGEWMLVGVPVAAVLLGAAYVLLTRVLFKVSRDEIPGGRAMLRERLRSLGTTSRAEWIVMGVFFATAGAWILRVPVTEILGIEGILVDDTVIVMIAAMVLFVMPAGGGARVLDWPTAQRLPWGVLLLFGGGLSLASAVDSSGLGAWIGSVVGGVGGMPTVVVIGLVTVTVVFLTELTSNTATATTLLPVLGASAVALGVGSLELLVAVALSCSCAFMMPVATPPNAIVFGSGQLRIGQMMRAGMWMNVVSTIVITLVAMLLVPRVLGGAP
jgi:solute carrier family 13 (sodium-dependent dicarboxylate transporter), member 2/3/5